MAVLVPTLRQPPDSYSCLPTAVRAVLLSLNVDASQEEVSEWCQEGPDGCWFDAAVEGLRMAGLDVQELTAADEEQIRELVASETDPLPVIVTLKDPFAAGTMDHAVVVVNVWEEVNSGVATETVEFLDPLTGRIERDASRRFWQEWIFAGRRNLVVYP